MEAHQILQSGFLDILFEGKNKSYGAYDLRKTYQQRIFKALLSTLVLSMTFALATMIGKKLETGKKLISPIIDATFLQKIEEKPKVLVKITTPVHTATTKVTKPVIVKTITDPPPTIKQIESSVIGTKTIEGPKIELGIVHPPVEVTGTKVIVKPKGNADENKGFIPIEKEAEFPGGDKAWQRYIQKAIQRQLDEFSDVDYGTCMVKFQVDSAGNVSNVIATTMKGTKLAEIAANTIKKGPKWIPALQNGRYVTAERIQPVTLLNPNE
jgi:protein TonB